MHTFYARLHTFYETFAQTVLGVVKRAVVELSVFYSLVKHAV